MILSIESKITDSLFVYDATESEFWNYVRLTHPPQRMKIRISSRTPKTMVEFTKRELGKQPAPAFPRDRLIGITAYYQMEPRS